ncbi:MAG: ArgE/DapE family deacylase [Candidatus Omnitrophota bacterium]|nr:ArgE/DapE family deacylase [Candidatus Omnitrophota bacterium]
MENSGLTILLQKLIRINSQNPPGDERKIIIFIRDYLRRLGVASKIYKFKKNRLNLVCKVKSQTSKRKILFTPHVDTVPATGKWRFEPLSGAISKGKIYGRGATDCKANVAVALYLIKKLKQEKIKLKNLDLVFAFCGDEETGSYYGTIPLAKFLKGIDYGVVLDADDFNIVVAQKGLLHLRIELFGKEAHGAYPERGVNAIEKGINILNEILKRRVSYKTHTLLKKPTLNIGRFIGGDKVNVVAGYCFFELDIRYLPFMQKQRIIADIEKIIKKQKIKYKIKVLAHQRPIEIDENIPSIKILMRSLKKHRIKPNLKPSFGATVINFLQEKGIESFAFGFGSQGQAHAKNEYVKVDNLRKGIAILMDYLLEFDSYLTRL